MSDNKNEEYPDLSEQIRRELERITNMRGVTLNFDGEEDDDEPEENEGNTVQLLASVEENTLVLNCDDLPSDWAIGKEIILNGTRFCNVPVSIKVPPPPPPLPLSPLGDKTNRIAITSPSTPAHSPSSKRPRDKENSVPPTLDSVEIDDQKVSFRRRKSLDLTSLISPTDIPTGFLAKLTRHGTFSERWCELDVQTKSFNYWKTRAARGVTAPTSLPVADIISVEWNAKDIKEGKRRNIIGMGGARFVITSKAGSVTWRAKDPLVTLQWITGIQDLMDQSGGHESVPAAESEELAEFDQKCGMLQRMNKAGRYKDRWCELDSNAKTLSYWAKKNHWDTGAPPKGVVKFEQVTSIVWNPDDVRKGKRRSLLSKDGVRFSLVLSDRSAQNWKSNNPLEASEWSKFLAAAHAKAMPQSA